MMLEKVDATFLDQTASEGAGVPNKAHFEKMFSTLAVLHAHCWGKTDEPGLSWVSPVDGPVFALFPPEVKKSWNLWVEKVANPGFECDDIMYAKTSVPDDVQVRFNIRYIRRKILQWKMKIYPLKNDDFWATRGFARICLRTTRAYCPTARGKGA